MKLHRVYAPDRKTILARVSSHCGSVSAAKAAGANRCQRAFIGGNGKLASGHFAWLVIDPDFYTKEL